MTKNKVLSIKALGKTYANGFKALDGINLDVYEGEIFALLGPNGAGKTTLIESVCGNLIATEGSVKVLDYDNKEEYLEARKCIGLVPQEIQLEIFETVWNTVKFTRELFGKPKDNNYLAELLQRLSLWDKKDNQLRTLSGGMKRRVMIAKALSHQPKILFLDEPTAGVDVELRKSLWVQVEELRQTGVTIVLTTHYIEEAEQMADRIGIINHGKLIMTESKDRLLAKMSNKQILFEFEKSLDTIPESLSEYNLTLSKDKKSLCMSYDKSTGGDIISKLLTAFQSKGVTPIDIHVTKRNLEDIFVEMVEEQ